MVNSDTALAKPNNQQQQGYSNYSCTPSNSSAQYEVHVLGVRRAAIPPRAGNATVIIVSRGKSNRPIVLVLGSYEPVNWILQLPANISISKVILVGTFAQQLLKEKKTISLRNKSLHNGNRAEWNPIRSVVIQVILKTTNFPSIVFLHQSYFNFILVLVQIL